MRHADQHHLADQLRRTLYAAGFVIALGSVWAMGWSQSRDAALAEQFSQAEPVVPGIVARSGAAPREECSSIADAGR